MSDDVFQRRSDTTSTSLIDRVKADQEEAWFELFRLYQNLFLYWIRRRGIEDSDASDILQEILMDVRRQIGRFQKRLEGRSFRPWLRTITMGKISDFISAQKKLPQTLGPDRFVDMPQPMEDWTEEGEGAEKNVLFTSALVLMKNSVAERDWNIFYQSVVCGRNATEIAEEFGLKPNNVRIIKHRVLLKFRTEFEYLLD